jgi:hypothetical protein
MGCLAMRSCGVTAKEHIRSLMTGTAYAVPFAPSREDMMPKLPPRPSALHFIGRATVLGAITAMAIACAQPDVTAPGVDATLRAVGAVTSMVATPLGQGPQACMPDEKLIGRIAVSTADVPGTWWRLTKDRFDELGVTDYKAALEGFYGQNFNTLDDAIQYLIDGVATYDANGNGYVCAFEVRGKRAYLGVNALYLLGIADDKHVEGSSSNLKP